MGNADQVTVEVAYARPDEQVVIELQINRPATLQQAIMDSGILQRFPEIDLAHNRVGIYGKLKPLNVPLHQGDRVEIYRPLIADPKEVRRKRARRQDTTQKLV
jgi:hypothetical protein